MLTEKTSVVLGVCVSGTPSVCNLGIGLDQGSKAERGRVGGARLASTLALFILVVTNSAPLAAHRSSSRIRQAGCHRGTEGLWTRAPN